MALYKQLGISYLSDIVSKENNGMITDKNILEEIRSNYGPDYRFSVSQFNEYGTCPFIFFAKRVLGLEPIEEPEDEIRAVDEGNLYHAILQELYSKGRDVIPIAEKHFKIAEEMGLIKNLALWKIKKSEIINNLKNLIQYEKEKSPLMGIERTPTYFEIPFGMEGKRPLVIDGVKIQGKIDRIDLTSSGLFVVIDYKTGGDLISISEIIKGTNIQLPIYIMAARDALEIGTDALEAYFLHLKRRRYFHTNPLIHYRQTKKGLRLNPQWDWYMNKTREYVSRYADSIRSGKFPASPVDECPSYCDYRDICRYQ